MFSTPDMSLHAGTPSMTVMDARALVVRRIACHRAVAGEAPDLRITRQYYDVLGRLRHSYDPRLGEMAPLPVPNFIKYHDLSGAVLRAESVDAGCSALLLDIEGRPVYMMSATGMIRRYQYEAPDLPGRLLAVSEQAPGAVTRVIERYHWAGTSAPEQDENLAGQCIRHYDTAGVIELQRCSLHGATLTLSRRLLRDAWEVNWSGEDESVWLPALENMRYGSCSTVDATAMRITHIDARGNVQRWGYDVAGQIKGAWVQLAGQEERVILASLSYSAAGQKLCEVHGNGVITEYRYEPETQRLVGMRSARASGHAAGARVLLDLRYTYDPVGNVLSERNEAQPVLFWRNQRVEPENTYRYDSLYQLIEASGRELAQRGQQGSALPRPVTPLPAHLGVYSNYRRTYRYDHAGNLVQIRHSDPATNNSYTTDITVSRRSNRAVLAQEGLLPEAVDTCFDAGGHQLVLLPGQALTWNGRGELEQVVPVSREGGDDREWYSYGGDGMRVQKVNERKASGSTRQQRVVYLPELEVHRTLNGASLCEALQVLTVSQSGQVQARLLHWETGRPTGLDNDGVRYSYGNQLGSSMLELDDAGELISQEEYYPYGGTSIWCARSQMEADYKAIRYSGKERDATGLYYYGFRYYQPWVGRWLSADPAGPVDGLNLFCMVGNNPITYTDMEGNARYVFPAFADDDLIMMLAAHNAQRRLVAKQGDVPVFLTEKERIRFMRKLEGFIVNSNKFKELFDFGKRHIDEVGYDVTPESFDRLNLRKISTQMTDLEKIREGSLSVSLYDSLVNIYIEGKSEERDRVFQNIQGGDKLYVLGHGKADYAGLEGAAEGGKALTFKKLARNFRKANLPDVNMKIALFSCESGNFGISEIDREEGAGVKPKFITPAQALLNELKDKGYRNLMTVGYRGNVMNLGFFRDPTYHHQQVLGEGNARVFTRSSQSKKVFH